MAKTTKQFVIVGLSGGVDSAVAALLLKNQGYHVEAVFMQNWEDDNNNCPISQDFQDAQAVCDTLNLKLHPVNFANEYWEKVFQHFLNEYAIGRTPNPDILCNKEIKFKAFLDYAKLLGADFIATGHYARLFTDNDNIVHLLKGIDQNKDQTYFLHLLNQEQLRSSMFPLGVLTKDKVRKIAEDSQLPNYDKKDSTGICFIGERKFRDFLAGYLLNRPGDIITTSGKKIGNHNGLMFYTIGQRQGIGIGGQKNSSESPWYVVEKNNDTNELVITQDKNHPKLMATELTCNWINWINGKVPNLPLNCLAKIRYRQQEQPCLVTQTKEQEKFLVKFYKPQWAITPGQAVVFYQNEECLGGGTIVL